MAKPLPVDLASSLAAGESYTSLGERHGVTRQTIANWAARPEVAAEVEAIHNAVRAASRASLVAAQTDMIDVLRKIAKDTEAPAAARISAATAVLDRSGLPRVSEVNVNADVSATVVDATGTDAGDALAAKMAGLLPPMVDDGDEPTDPDDGA